MRIKQARDRLVLRMPVISLIAKKINIARSVRAFEAGSYKSFSNSYYQAAVARVLERTKRGERLSQVLKDYPDLFPLTVVQMIEVGEETGALADILKKLGEFFETEAADAVKELIIVIKSAFMIILGGLVGLFLVSLIQRIFIS